MYPVNTTRQENYGWTLAASGIFIALFSHWIVFSGLKRVFGIDGLIGADSLLHLSGGDLAYNPTKTLFRWVTLTTVFGLVVAAAGTLLVLKVRADLWLHIRRFTTTTPFTLTATFSLVHAATPIAYMTLMGIARHAGWTSPTLSNGLGMVLWIGGVLTWPVWYAVVPQANRKQGFSPVIPLVVGTVIWGLSALPVAGLFLMLLFWRGC